MVTQSKIKVKLPTSQLSYGSDDNLRYPFLFIHADNLRYPPLSTNTDNLRYSSLFNHEDNFRYPPLFTHTDNLRYPSLFTHEDNLRCPPLFTHAPTTIMLKYSCTLIFIFTLINYTLSLHFYLLYNVRLSYLFFECC